MIEKIYKVFTKILWTIVIFSLIGLIVLVTCQVLARIQIFRFLAPPDEIVTLLFVWMTYFGSIILFGEKSHLRVEFLELYLHGKWKIGCYILQDVVTMITLLLLTYSGIQLFMGSHMRTSPMLHWSQGIWYFALVFSFCVMTLYSIVFIAQDVMKLKKENA